jgi:ribonuclease T2
MVRSLKKAFVLAIVLVCSFMLFSNSAQALVPFEGQFTAVGACEALSSIKKGTNPGNVRLKPGQTYQVVGKNKDEASHYLLDVPSARPPQRWVATSCVSADGLPTNTTGSTDTTDSTPSVPPIIPVAIGKEYLLALSWQPAFCETKPNKIECKTLALNPNRPEATRFALHGLWPQPKGNDYCDVSQSDIALDKAKSWSKLPPIEQQLSPETWKRLQEVMPGTASYLHRHEWIKHGTCYQGTPEEYYAESIALLDAFNSSPLQPLVANYIGRQLAIKDIDQALSSFGANAGDKIEVKCDNSVLGELWINLEGDITLNTPIADLLTNSPNAKREKYASCLIDDARD